MFLDGNLKEKPLLKNSEEESRKGEDQTNVTDTLQSEEFSTKRPLSKSSDGGTIVPLERPESDPSEPDGVKSTSGVDSKTEKSNSEEAVIQPDCKCEGAAPASPQKVSAVVLEGASLVESDLISSSSAKEKGSSTPPQASLELEGAKSGLVGSEAEGVKPMETTEPELCDKLIEKAAVGTSQAPGDGTLDADRKRQHESGTPECVDDDDSQLPKRTRLDEILGKLGERVTFPSDAPENGSFECDSTPGDMDSVEKRLEEISGSASDEEEKTASSCLKPKMKITKQVSKQLLCADILQYSDHLSTMLVQNMERTKLKW